jgi:hypothetical protein
VLASIKILSKSNPYRGFGLFGHVDRYRKNPEVIFLDFLDAPGSSSDLLAGP